MGKENEFKNKEDMEIFDVVGSFGPWQRRVFLVFLIINIPGMWQNLSVTFLAPNMDFRCVYPPPSNQTVTSDITYDDRCLVPQGVNQTILVPCRRWEYDTSFTSQTIVSEWDLVCDREWLVSLAKSMYMIGFLFSVIIFGQISDCIGRLPTITVCFLITLVSMFLSLLSINFTMFILLRFFQAFGRAGVTTVGYVLVMELIGPKHKAKIGIGIQMGWSLGFVSLVAVAWFFRHWFWLQLVLSLSLLPIALTYVFVPESPRWLLMKGKTERLEKILTKAAVINGREMAEKIDLNKMKIKTEEKGNKTMTLLEVFKMPRMRCRLFNMIYLWLVNGFMYYGLSYNTNDLAGNPYLTFFIAGMLEFPAYAIVYWGIKSWGRRPTMTSLIFAGGVSFLALLLTPSDMPWLQTTFAMTGKMCITGSFRLVYLYTTELFPTSVRNVTLGTCSMFARIGSILSPFIRDLGKATHPLVPNILYMLLAVTSGSLALMLPETRDLDIPDTMQEGENLGLTTYKAVESNESPETVRLSAEV